MADLKESFPRQYARRFYVDRERIDGDVCCDTSPANFDRNDESGYSFVHKQALTDEEFALRGILGRVSW